MEKERTDVGAPIQSDMTGLTNSVLQAMGDADLETALTVLCNVLGHTVAAMSGGRPSDVQRHGDLITENVKKAAIAKLLYDDAMKRGN